MRARRRAQMPPSIQLPIETPRLVLRDFRAADLEAVHAYASRDEVGALSDLGADHARAEP